MPTLFLTRKDVRGLLNMAEVIEAVEQALRDWARGKATMPPKAYLLLEKGDIRAMPAALEGVAGMKWANVHPQNSAMGLPTVMATLIYNDPATGYPLAVMDATEITAYRTGATAAIASKYLARKDARTLGIIGAGRQAYSQLQAHIELFELESIRVFDVSDTAIKKLMASFSGYPLQASSLGETAASDIVCTLTTATKPVLKRELITPGTHINAVGADAPGKQELELAILKEAMVVVDDIRQASSAGEINVPVNNGLYTEEDVYGNLGEIIAGMKPGRVDDRLITVFDSTGVAIEDIATARIVYQKAVRKGGYLSLDFVDE
ncbi:MAG: ornithine cyclodeaminase family protein [Dehalococcoidia bacterium]|nr:MAG: ornithine cyclodeaminase family protein [Dehalococcoidia bacterium]